MPVRVAVTRRASGVHGTVDRRPSRTLEGQDWEVTMRIGELAERAGISAKAIRYYEQVGILAPPARTTSGYRAYDEAVLGRLGFVRAAQALGLTLGEIRQIIAFRDDGAAPCAHVTALLQRRADELERRIARLRLWPPRTCGGTAPRRRRRPGSPGRARAGTPGRRPRPARSGPRRRAWTRRPAMAPDPARPAKRALATAACCAAVAQWTKPSRSSDAAG